MKPCRDLCHRHLLNTGELYGLLKRPDEKYVTERAYDNPKFVEDMVRDVALRLDAETRIGAYGALPTNFDEKLRFLVRLLFDPLIFSGFAAAFLASFAWMAAMTKWPQESAPLTKCGSSSGPPQRAVTASWTAAGRLWKKAK